LGDLAKLRDSDDSRVASKISRVVFGGATILCASWLATNAIAERAPKPGERKAIVAAVVKVQGSSVRVRRVAVSTIDKRYATIRWSEGPTTFEVTEILHRSIRGWTILWGRRRGEPSDGACAFAPSAIVVELYGVRCPSWVALHARVATPGEHAQLVKAFRQDALTRPYRTAARVTRTCVSRLDPRFAAAAIDLSSTGGFVWFERNPWRVVFETVASSGTLPSPKVVLSLASCVGYNAGQYGG
jgi:hypothetical protein